MTGYSEKTDGGILAATDANQIFGQSNVVLIPGNSSLGHNFNGFCAHSATLFSVVFETSGIYLFNSSAQTWTSKNANINSTINHIKNCRADITKAIAVQNTGTAKCAFTTNSGTTWTSGTALPAGLTAINSINYPVSALAVLGGDSAGATIYRSTNNGSTWSAATTYPATSVSAIYMYDSSTGVCIDSSLNIYKTVNGGVDWTDTTYNAASIQTGTLIMSDATTYFFSGSSNDLYKGTLSSSPTLVANIIGGKYSEVINGNLIFIDLGVLTSGTSRIWVSYDSGASFNLSPMIGSGGVSATYASKCSNLTMIDTNTFAFFPLVGNGAGYEFFYKVTING